MSTYAEAMYTNVALCETHKISYREWKEKDWSLRFAREGTEDARSVTITRCIWTITLSKCRVMLKSMYTNVALCETHKISYREWKEEDWSLIFAREGVQKALSVCITRCIWTITLSKCRVILKSIYPDVALCKTHRISYREWKEEDWSLRFVREGVQNTRC